LDRLLPELQLDDPRPGAEDAGKMLESVAGDFGVADRAEAEGGV
jgi:hypothetical protein